jgi:hypothetical protein
MFYTKKIYNLKQSDGYKDDMGIWNKGKLNRLYSIDCDVQPIAREVAKRDFGIDTKVEYRIFCDNDNNITDGAIIEYQGENYRVEKAIIWDSYIDMVVAKYDI